MTATPLITETKPTPVPSSMAQRLVAAGHRYVFPSSTSETGRSKVIRGTAWVLGGTAASQALRAASTIFFPVVYRTGGVRTCRPSDGFYFRTIAALRFGSRN